MKNKEKFSKEIVEVAITGQSIAVSNNGKIGSCREIRCKDCKFVNSEDCDSQLKEWAEAEYVEQKVFTEEEKAILRALPNANWVVRDNSGVIYLYNQKPVKNTVAWYPVYGLYICLDQWCDVKFKSVLWEDEEPTSREEILK